MLAEKPAARFANTMTEEKAGRQILFWLSIFSDANSFALRSEKIGWLTGSNLFAW